MSMMNQINLSLLLCVSFLTSCAQPSSGALTQGDSQPNGSFVESSLAQSEPPVSSADPFEKDFENEDIIYQRILRQILDERDLGKYAQNEVSSGMIAVYCKGISSERILSASDFPEIEVQSVEASDEVHNGVYAVLALKEKTKERVANACFALIDNPLVTYARPKDGSDYYVLPWTTPEWTEGDQSRQTTIPSVDDEPSLYDQYGFSVIEDLPENQYDEKKMIPGYIWVELKRTENCNGKVYTPNDFPGVGANDVIEQFSASSSRRYLVVGIEDQTAEASKNAIRTLSENSIVHFSVYYRKGGNSSYA